MSDARIILDHKKINYSLDNISAALGRLGNPHHGIKFVHVAGTNGKGSTCAFLSSILSAEGLRVGTFTSPFFVSATECIRVNGVEIKDSGLRELTQVAAAAASVAGVPLTGFESLAAAAFMHFRDERCDICVVEAGMGGRRDATNVVEATVSVVSGVAMDHSEYLGTKLTDIAFEKASIVKPGGILVARSEDAAVRKVIERTAAENKAEKVIFVDESVRGRLVSSGTEGLEFYAASAMFPETLYRTRMAGSYQFGNALCAICAADALAARGTVKLSPASVRLGIERAQWPARFEIVNRDGRIFVVDGAHNLDGMKAFAAAFKKLFPEARAIVITGILKNKEFEPMLDEVIEISKKMFLCDFESRGEQNGTRHLSDYLNGRGMAAEGIFSSYKDALERVFAESELGDVICVTGSLYLAGPVSLYLKAGGHGAENR